MNNINDLQNQDASLQKLAAQRCLYSEAKNIFYLRTTLALAAAIALPYVGSMYPNLKNWFAAVAILYLIVDIFVLNELESAKRHAGAKTQELFDTEVLGIQWNQITVGEKPDHEDVGRCLLKVEGKGFDDFRNWYPSGVADLPVGIARTLCQRANVWWDSSLRRWYAHFLLLIVIIFGGFVVWTSRDKTVASAIVFLAPFVPLFKILIEQNISHRKAAKRLDVLKNQLNQILDRALAAPESSVDEFVTRSIQDEIYRHRSNATSIPNFFYKLLKNRYEGLMNFSADGYIQNYTQKTVTSASGNSNGS